VDYALYERIRKLRESFMAPTDKLGQVYADVPAETAEAEINSAALQLPQAHDRLASPCAAAPRAHPRSDHQQPCQQRAAGALNLFGSVTAPA
jgi:hypothetical protein